MKDIDKLSTYLATAPGVATISAFMLAGLLIEINRFVPDLLVF
ncbi:MAG: Photosystem I reaction center subunit IX [Cyanobacteria bacterium P01_G01_bin.4]